MVDILCEEIVEIGFVGAAIPGSRNFTVGIPCPGDNEPFVFPAFGGFARGGGIGDDVHTHCSGYVADLAADAAVAEDAETLADFVMEVAEKAEAGLVFAPFVLLLPGVEHGEVVGRSKHGHEDPFRDLRTMDA